jgi:hypothetical protein
VMAVGEKRSISRAKHCVVLLLHRPCIYRFS